MCGLLDCAVNLAEQGEISVRASTACDAGCCQLRLEVRTPALDAGQHWSAILDQLDRADIGILNEHGRIGLELALCKRLAAMMGARIGIDHRPQEAQSTFWFAAELPLASDSGSTSSSSIGGKSTTLQHKDGPPYASLRILVVDDNAVNRQVAQRMVEKLGFQVDAADDGQQAIDLHNAHPYDLILMDCQMPNLDGYQATQRIRAQEGASRRTPIVALTACSTPDEWKKCQASGMDDFITKPLRPRILQQTLGNWLRPVATEPPASSPADELDAVRAMFGQNFAELATLYLTDSPTHIAALHEAGAARDYSRVAKVAHAFSGSCASIGASGLSLLCKDMEMRAKANTLGNGEAILMEIDAEYARICEKLRAMTQPGPEAI